MSLYFFLLCEKYILLKYLINIFENKNVFIFVLIGVSIFASINMVYGDKPLDSVGNFIISVISVIILMFFMNIEFLPLVFLVVYIGAVAILILFIVMLLNLNIYEDNNIKNKGSKFSFWSFIFYIIIFIWFWLIFLLNDELILTFDDNYLNVIKYTHLKNINYTYYNYLEFIGIFSEVEALAELLYQQRFWYFIISSLILLVAMIGAILMTISFRFKKSINLIKKQNINEQVFRSLRLKFIKN